MKRLFLAAPVIAVAAAVVMATTGGAQAPGERTFKLVERPTSFKFIDQPPRQGQNRRPTPGDYFVFSSRLFDASGARVGNLIAHCIVPAPSTLPLECEGIFKLKDGQITGAAVTTESKTTRIAINGGTGAYEGARGTITSVTRTNADNSPADDTVHLLG